MQIVQIVNHCDERKPMGCFSDRCKLLFLYDLYKNIGNVWYLYAIIDGFSWIFK